MSYDINACCKLAGAIIKEQVRQYQITKAQLDSACRISDSATREIALSLWEDDMRRILRFFNSDHFNILAMGQGDYILRKAGIEL